MWAELSGRRREEAAKLRADGLKDSEISEFFWNLAREGKLTSFLRRNKQQPHYEAVYPAASADEVQQPDDPAWHPIEDALTKLREEYEDRQRGSTEGA